MLFRSSVKAMAALIDTAVAEWLEGIPPVFHRKVAMVSFNSGLRERRSFIMDFRNWAMRRLYRAERKMGFENKSSNAAGAIAAMVQSGAGFVNPSSARTNSLAP